MDTPRAIPLNLLQHLFTPLAGDIGCGLLIAEIRGDGSGAPGRFVGRVVNQLFCHLLSLRENEILDQELPESLCRTLSLSSLLQQLAASGATRMHSDISLGSGRTHAMQMHLPCPELLAITVHDAGPDGAMISSQTETILNSLGDPCTVIDRNFFIIYENEIAKKLSGSKRGKHCYTIYHGRQSRCESCHAAEVFSDGQIHKNERTRRINGKEHHMEITSAPLTNAEGDIFAVVNIANDITTRKMEEKSKEHLIKELQTSLVKTKRLNGLLPICSCCKKIKDNNGVWQQLESYLRSHAEVEFSHAICHECSGKPFPANSTRKKKK